MKNFIYAITTLVGTIVGVGIFALPFTARESGFFVTLFYLLVLGGLATLLHLMLGEIFLRTEGNHRIPGLVRLYLGGSWYTLARITTIIGITGTLLVYLIVGGIFLSQIFNTPASTSVVVFWAIFSLFILSGFVLFEIAELVMATLLVAITLLTLGIAYPHIAWNNFFSDTPLESNLFFPYGIVLFSLLGTVAIPAVHRILKPNLKYFRRVLIIGTLIPLILYIVFIAAVYGVSGNATTPDAIQGFAKVIGNGFVPFLYLFGLLAIATSYIVLGRYAYDAYSLDFKLSRFSAALGALGIPLGLYFAGFENYIQIIGVLGSILGSVEGILLLMIHKQAQNSSLYTPAYSLTISSFWYGVLALVLIYGFGAGVLSLLTHLLI